MAKRYAVKITTPDGTIGYFKDKPGQITVDPIRIFGSKAEAERLRRKYDGSKTIAEVVEISE